jgi:hypothetical protein
MNRPSPAPDSQRYTTAALERTAEAAELTSGYLQDVTDKLERIAGHLETANLLAYVALMPTDSPYRDDVLDLAALGLNLRGRTKR